MKTVLFFLLISCFCSCDKFNDQSVFVVKENTSLPHLADDYSALHKIGKDYILHNYAVDFCEGDFNYTIKLSSLEKIKLTFKGECCCGGRIRNNLSILINEEGKYLVDVDFVKGNLYEVLEKNYKDQNLIFITYDSLADEERLVYLLEELDHMIKHKKVEVPKITLLEMSQDKKRI